MRLMRKVTATNMILFENIKKEYSVDIAVMDFDGLCKTTDSLTKCDHIRSI